MFVYNKKFLLDYEYYKQTGDYMAFISVQALAERNQMTVADVKKVCRHNKVQVNNTVPGVYMIDEDDYMNKLSGIFFFHNKIQFPQGLLICNHL